MIAEIRAAYKNKIDSDLKVNPELRRALKTNERVPVFIDNLAAEISRTNIIRSKRGKPIVTKSEITWIVESMTDVFLAGLESMAKERVKSDLKKAEDLAKIKAKKDVEDTLAGKETDLTEELGITLGGSRGEEDSRNVEA